jgi:hypothetical protein
MTRTGQRDYVDEHAFLIEMKATIENELAHRARRVAERTPALADQMASLLETPIERWPREVDRGVLGQLHPLKLEERFVDDLTQAISKTALVKAIDKRIAHLEQEEIEITHQQPFGRYLTDSAYWRDEDALAALNRIFKNWARWCRSEPLEVP